MKKIRWIIEDLYYGIKDKTFGRNPYNIPYNKTMIALSGGILASSFALPFVFPIPAGFGISGFLMKRFGRKKIYLDFT